MWICNIILTTLSRYLLLGLQLYSKLGYMELDVKAVGQMRIICMAHAL